MHNLVCGILGMFSIGPGSRLEALPDSVALAMRDTLTRRGPDGAGLTRPDGAILGHRRLAIIDPGPHADQPMSCQRGRYHLIYNGELYNDAELRRRLASEGVTFRTSCDSETVLMAMAAWGPGAVDRFRGMYALAMYDSYARTLTLARDPLGIKPLCWALVGATLVVASEPRAILAMPGTPQGPDFASLSAYCTTIRTTLQQRTMYEAVRTLRPGERAVIQCSRTHEPSSSWSWWDTPREGLIEGEGDPAETARIVRDSVREHLRSDVPVGLMLSGGLDSAILAHCLREQTSGEIRSYCAVGEDDRSADADHAEAIAESCGFVHTTIRISAREFRRQWRSMVEELASPLGTPNEVAIRMIAARMRADGVKVALSGEGADELFCGYPIPALLGESAESSGEDPGLALLDQTSWIPWSQKSGVFHKEIYSEAQCDAPMLEAYRGAWAQARAGAWEPDAGAAFSSMLRMINLSGLLARLDTSTMLESVEGRTPLADQVVALHAESLAMRDRISSLPNEEMERYSAGNAGETGALAIAPAATAPMVIQTKIALRRAFADCLPASVVHRRKASFPLPFADWIAPEATELMETKVATDWFTQPARALVASEPVGLWSMAWPMCNAALWGETRGF